jgi:quinoprotein glucose dehydrogenase
MTTPSRLVAGILLGRAVLGAGLPVSAGVDWPEYNGGPERSHYSALRQITPENVGQLRRAWEYHTGDFGMLECNPIVVGGVLYGVTAASGAFAVEAATGKELWRYRPGEVEWAHAVRGVTYWSEGEDRRIFFTAGPWLIALDARTGLPLPAFGQGGRVSLRVGLGPQAARRPLSCSTPGTLYGDLLVMPLWTSEDTNASPGFIQAFDVHDGRLVWVFHTLPQPGEPGYETWPKDAYKNIDVGSANCWAGLAVDRRRGILYAGTGSAAPDFWGGHRKGRDLYANCEIALDARTGKLLWHFQIVHHDLWDRDMPAPPNLLTVRRGGRSIDAVAQVTKAGLVFVFDRVTGEPLFPVREVPAPASEVPGEETWPTQPRPDLPAPFTRQTITENDINPWAQNHDALVAYFRNPARESFSLSAASTIP